MTSDEVEAGLLAAMEARDPVAFERALDLAFGNGVHAGLSTLLAQALSASWHFRHEAVARALQDLKDPATVDAIFHAARVRHHYLEHDDSDALARKCTWALADIGTPEARLRLEELARSGDVSVARHAQKRLDGWQEELDRKGARKSGSAMLPERFRDEP